MLAPSEECGSLSEAEQIHFYHRLQARFIRTQGHLAAPIKLKYRLVQKPHRSTGNTLQINQTLPTPDRSCQQWKMKWSPKGIQLNHALFDIWSTISVLFLYYSSFDWLLKNWLMKFQQILEASLTLSAKAEGEKRNWFNKWIMILSTSQNPLCMTHSGFIGTLKVLPWPSESPDLNIIETLWRLSKEQSTHGITGICVQNCSLLWGRIKSLKQEQKESCLAAKRVNKASLFV